MSLDEIFRDEPMISQAEALAEVNRHGQSVHMFLNECGDEHEYNSREVLEWLGY